MHRLALFALLAACGTRTGPTQPYVPAVGAMRGQAVDELAVEVSSLRSDAGTVRCYLYDGADGFPDNAAHLAAKAVALPAGRAATCRFTGLATARDYAIVVLHDEDNDGVFKKGPFGIPAEGYGFSNDARARFSAPSFDACRIRYGKGHQSTAIKMGY